MDGLGVARRRAGVGTGGDELGGERDAGLLRSTPTARCGTATGTAQRGTAGSRSAARWSVTRRRAAGGRIASTASRGARTARLWHCWYEPAGWQAVGVARGQLASDPTACAWGPDRIDVFARGTSGDLIHAAWNGRAWSFDA